MSAENHLRAKHWIFTVNNPTDEDLAVLHWLENQVLYGAWQLERGDESTLHIQGYAGFKTQLRFSRVKQLLPRAHWSIALMPDRAWIYCQKEASRVEGYRFHSNDGPTPATSGLKGNRWLLFKTYVMDHEWINCVDEFIDLYKDEKTMRKIYENYKFPSNDKQEKKVIVLWGPPGVGKTYAVTQLLHDEGEAYYNQTGSKWFDGYAYENTIVIHDMEPNRFVRSWFLQLLDYGSVMAETKGGNCKLIAKNIIITSNLHPKDWWTTGDARAVIRRMNVYHVEEKDHDTCIIGLDQLRGNTVPAVALSCKQNLYKMLDNPSLKSSDDVIIPSTTPPRSPTATPLDLGCDEQLNLPCSQSINGSMGDDEQRGNTGIIIRNESVPDAYSSVSFRKFNESIEQQKSRKRYAGAELC